MLGIATGLLGGTLKRKQTDFIYLLYDPTDLEIESDIKTEIERIYERTCYECNLVDFAELFHVILEFLNEKNFKMIATGDDIDNMALKFTFTLASQKFYPDLI